MIRSFVMLIYLLILQPYIVRRKHNVKLALILFVFNLSFVCFSGLLYPFYNMSIFIILSLLTFTNITILLVPKRIVDEIGLLLTHIPFPKGLLLVVLSIIRVC